MDIEIDPIVEAVRYKLLARSQAGIAKYGVTMDRGDLDFFDWLKHFQEELLDGAVYAEKLMQSRPLFQRIWQFQKMCEERYDDPDYLERLL